MAIVAIPFIFGLFTLRSWVILVACGVTSVTSTSNSPLNLGCWEGLSQIKACFEGHLTTYWTYMVECNTKFQVKFKCFFNRSRGLDLGCLEIRTPMKYDGLS